MHQYTVLCMGHAVPALFPSNAAVMLISRWLTLRDFIHDCNQSWTLHVDKGCFGMFLLVQARAVAHAIPERARVTHMACALELNSVRKIFDYAVLHACTNRLCDLNLICIRLFLFLCTHATTDYR
jgi:hypothetical protein